MLSPSYCISCNIALSLWYYISIPSSFRRDIITVQQYFISVLKKNPHNVLMLFLWMNQQFCELSIGCKRGPAETKSPRKGSEESHARRATKHLIQWMNWDLGQYLDKSLWDQHFYLFSQALGKLLPPLFASLFIWLSLCPSSVIPPSLLPSYPPCNQSWPMTFTTQMSGKNRQRKRERKGSSWQVWRCREEEAVLTVR